MMYTGLMKLTWNNRDAETINEVFVSMKFPELMNMSNIQVRILSFKCSYSFFAGDLAHDRHKDTMKKIDDAEDKVDFNENIACDH